MNWPCRCPWYTHWSPSWSTSRCVSVGWVTGSLERSWVPGLASSARKRWEKCSSSWIGGPLLVWAIRPGSVRWTVCGLRVGWTVSGKLVDHPWDGFGVWSSLPIPGHIYPGWWPLVFGQDVDILTSIRFWSSKMASFFDFFSGPCSLLNFW